MRRHGRPEPPSHEAPEQQQIAEQIADDVPRGGRAVLRRFRDDVRLLRTTKYGLGPLFVIFVIDLLQGIDDRIPTLFLPEIRKEFGVTLTKLVFVQQLFVVVGLAGVLLIGYLTDRYRRTRMVGISAVLSGVFSFGAASSGNVYAYQGLQSFDSVSEQLGNVPTSSLLFDYYPIEARAKTVAVRRVAATLVGPFTTVVIGVGAAYYGWRGSLRILAPLLVLSGIWVLFVLREPTRGYWERLRAGESEETAETPQPPMKFGEAFRTLMAIKTVRRLLFAMPILTVVGGGFTTLYTLYIVEEFRLSPTDRTLLSVPGQVLGVIAVLYGAVLFDGVIKKNAGKVLIVNGLLGVIAAFSQVAIVFLPSLWLVIGFGLVLGVIRSALEPAVYAASSLVIPPRLRGQGLGIFVLVAIPTIPFAVLPAYIADTYGIRTGLLVYAPGYILASLISVSAARFFSFDQRAAVAAANATNEYNRAKAEGTIKLLLVRDVDVEYDGVQVLFNVDLDVDAGEMVALLGTNGAGKSTLLRAISGIREASSGAIFFDGRDITHLPPHEIARLGIVHMSGGRAVFPGLTVQENLDLALMSLEPSAELDARREAVFDFFPVLRERLDQEAGLLSGGEQQMVGLAQAFLWKPRLLMIDELSLGLAPAVVGQLLDIVRAINAQGATVVLVEQSVNVALTVTQRAVFMEKGEVRFDGPTADLLQRPDIMRAVYLKGTSTSVTARSSRAEALIVDRARPLLEVSGLRKVYGGVRAVDDVSFVVHEGEALGLIGPNGAGKTTVFDLVSGYLPADRGTVHFDGVDITRLSAEERGRLRLVRRFQDAKLFGSLTVLEAICVALDRHLDVRSVFVSALPVGAVRRSEARIRARASRLVDLLELGSYRDKFVNDLSTGVRRVVDLACVLAAEPRLLMLDEPSSGIAQAEAEGLAPLLGRIRQETGCSLLIIEHDMTLIRRASDELLAMVQGRVVTRGPADDVLTHPEVVAAYLGDDDAAVTRSGVLLR
jgi:ABC-type branched-subunit amino acid transport system ATPase component